MVSDKKLCSSVVLAILQELKPHITEAHERYRIQQERLAKIRSQQGKSAGPPAPPATFKAAQEKQLKFQETRGNQVESRELNGVVREPWDLIKQMQGIKFVSGRPQVQEQSPPPPRTKMEFQYPAILPVQMYRHLPIDDPHLTVVNNLRRV